MIMEYLYVHRLGEHVKIRTSWIQEKHRDRWVDIPVCQLHSEQGE